MVVACPFCGNTSTDPEFCDFCNADLADPPASPPTTPCPLPGGSVDLTGVQRNGLLRPEAWIKVARAERSWRVHWVARGQLDRWLPRLRERQALTLPCLPLCSVVEEAAGAWVQAEANGKAFAPWDEPPHDDATLEVDRLLLALAPLARALEALHEQGLIWLTFDPLALEETSGGLQFTNLDMEIHRTGKVAEGAAVKLAFTAPEIIRAQEPLITPRADVFHLSMFAYYWLARLLPGGFAGAGLPAFDYAIPPLRVYRPNLPLGIADSLIRGLAVELEKRWAEPGELIAALEDANRRFSLRRQSIIPTRWQIGSHTRTGRTKEALGRANEDNVVVRTFTEPERALLVVADGISSCDVGSGALASLITTLVLENGFAGDSHADDFVTRLPDLCRRAAQTLLEWAQEKGYSDQLRIGADLMGTTLTAAWLEGNMMHLANIGDSRAYLFDDAGLEQLTVDGDLGSGLLATGNPPEQVRELGPIAKALRECIGGCGITPAGTITILDESCHPALARWPLLPGDIVILCSDGLVEEGAFLSAQTLGELLSAYRALPADQIALCLADAAEALQRRPSPLEPEGLGDNITCIVVKVDSA